MNRLAGVRLRNLPTAEFCKSAKEIGDVQDKNVYFALLFGLGFWLCPSTLHNGGYVKER